MVRNFRPVLSKLCEPSVVCLTIGRTHVVIDTNSNRQGEPHLIYLVYLTYLPGYRVIRDNIGKGSLLSIRLIYMHTKQGLTVECTLLIT